MVRRLSRLAFAVVGVLAILTVSAAPAFAHAVLLSTNPPDGTSYPTSAPPTSVSVHFGESVGVKLGAVRVYDGQGHLINSGPPGHPAGDGSTVSASLPKLDAGTYVVTWRVISADTHPVSGAFTFTVGNQKQNVNQLATRLLSSANGSRTVGVLYGTDRFLLFASLIAFLGGSAFLAVVWPEGRRSRRAARILWVAWLVGLGVTLFGFAIEGIYAAAFPLRDLLNRTVLSDTLHGRYGETALARVALLVVATALLRLLLISHKQEGRPARSLRWWAPAAALVGLATLATVTLASHGTTGRWTGIALPADVLHLSAVSFWFGGLLMLTAAVVPTAGAETLDRIAPRYSNFAFAAVLTIVASGTFQAYRQVGSFHALIHTSYGHFLLAKLAAFSVLILIAALSRKVVDTWYVPHRFERTGTPEFTIFGAPALTGTDPAPREDAAERRAYRQLTLTIRAEVVIAVVVLIFTAFLVDARPAYEVTNGPQILTLKSSPSQPPVVWFNLVIEPAKRGLNQIHLSTETPEGGLANPLQVTMQLTNPSHNVGPLQVLMIRIGPGHYIDNSYEIPFAGTWQITVKALMTQIDESIATQNVTIR